MRKMLAIFILAVLTTAVPVNAQAIRWGYIPQTTEGWYYLVNGDQVGMLTADNLGMVRAPTHQLRRSEIRSLSDDLVWNGAAYGVNTARGFYPMYDHNMRPMSRREASITGAAIGAAIGFGVSGNTRGTAIGAAGGAIVGLLTHRGNSNKNDIGTRPNRQVSVSNQPSTAGDWRVSNRTSKRAELWDGEQFVARIESGRSIQVDAPRNGGYKAILLIPNRSGGLNREAAQIRGNDNLNGWDIVSAAVR